MNKEKKLLIRSFCSYLTKIYHFCPFFVRFCPFLSDFVHFCQFFFSKKYNFRPFKAILDRFWPVLSIFCPLVTMFVRLIKYCIYLPKQVSFIDPQSTMYFLASSIHSSAKYSIFALGAALLGQKKHIWPRRAAPPPKNR